MTLAGGLETCSEHICELIERQRASADTYTLLKRATLIDSGPSVSIAKDLNGFGKCHWLYFLQIGVVEESLLSLMTVVVPVPSTVRQGTCAGNWCA